MLFQNPPHTNGIMQLTDEEMLTILEKLEEIQAGFVPTLENPVCDLFYMTSKYNEKNELQINGDTVSMILSMETTVEKEAKEEE